LSKQTQTKKPATLNVPTHFILDRKNTMKFLTAFTLILLGGCAQMYTPPVSVAKNLQQPTNQPTPALFSAATRALAANGYQITNSDKETGVISTAPRDLRINETQADCGTFMGVNGYLADNRTKTQVSYNIIISNGKIEIKTNIQAVWITETENITLTCISIGTLEKDMYHKVMAEIN
jgi:hypothetical protein